MLPLLFSKSSALIWIASRIGAWLLGLVAKMLTLNRALCR